VSVWVLAVVAERRGEVATTEENEERDEWVRKK
jgi:hypothetical protein